MTEKEAIIGLCAFNFFGPVRIKLLTSYFKSARNVWVAKREKLAEVGLKEKIVDTFDDFRNKFDAHDYFIRLKRLAIKTVILGEADYPENLAEIEDAPPVLYVKGRLSQSDSNAVAIVGARKMTSYGKEVTEKLSGELASFGITIISGLARGVDTGAHRSAVESGGRTIAVLGCGLDKVYPPENFQLAKRIAENGALVSEYPLGYPALRINFANRNRIISGLSKAIVVVEGAQKSGTLLTASSAAKQGREVFAVPGQITSPLSFAPLYLIKNGAKMATSSQDILEELSYEVSVDREKTEKALPKTKEEAEILSILENEPLHLDEIVRISSLDAPVISARLTVMELKGLVRNMGRGVYKKT